MPLAPPSITPEMTTAAPRVSVIMPTHNRAELLRRSVLSVLSQTYRDFELIVVDDCSKDHTQQVLAEFSDPRLRVIRRETNGRAAAARNDGIAAARGELIAFQDDDDIWLAHKLERQVAALDAAGPDIGLMLCSYIRWRTVGILYIGGEHHYRRVDFSRGKPQTIDYGLIATPAWLVRRTALEAAGPFDTRFKSWDDWELALRLWKICRIGHVDEPLFIQDHVLGSQMMRNERGQYEDLEVILEKHGSLWERNRRLQAEHYFYVGRRAGQYVSPEAGRVWLRKAVAIWPLHLKAWGGLLLLRFGPALGLVYAYRRLRHLALLPVIAWRKHVRGESEPRAGA
jgi:glycosyltransferase involved in cell wall biosynthesis